MVLSAVNRESRRPGRAPRRRTIASVGWADGKKPNISPTPTTQLAPAPPSQTIGGNTISYAIAANSNRINNISSGATTLTYAYDTINALQQA